MYFGVDRTLPPGFPPAGGEVVLGEVLELPFSASVEIISSSTPRMISNA